MISPVFSTSPGFAGRSSPSDRPQRVIGVANGQQDRPFLPPGQGKKAVRQVPAQEPSSPPVDAEKKRPDPAQKIEAAQGSTKTNPTGNEGQSEGAANGPENANATGAAAANSNSRHTTPDRPDSASFGAFRLQQQPPSSNLDQMRDLASAAYAQAAADRLISVVTSLAKGWSTDPDASPPKGQTATDDPGVTVDIRSPADAVAETA